MSASVRQYSSISSEERANLSVWTLVISVAAVQYRVDVTTGPESTANYSKLRIFVRLFGDRGDSGRRLLNRSTADHEARFQHGRTDSFQLEAVSLGDLVKLVISHTNIAPGSSERGL